MAVEAAFAANEFRITSELSSTTMVASKARELLEATELSRPEPRVQFAKPDGPIVREAIARAGSLVVGSAETARQWPQNSPPFASFAYKPLLKSRNGKARTVLFVLQLCDNINLQQESLISVTPDPALVLFRLNGINGFLKI